MVAARRRCSCSARRSARGTCYYYRKAYYRAFFADPTACAVGEPWKGYRGERSFPFVLQNLHRYLIYLAIPLLFFLWSDVIRAFTFDGQFCIGVCSLAILASNALLTAYTFSCHSIRHLVGGRVDCFSCVVAGGPRHKVWQTSSWLNAHHMVGRGGACSSSAPRMPTCAPAPWDSSTT